MQKPVPAKDADLIAATIGGDDRAFAEIVRRYEPTVARTVIGMLGPGDEAEEAGQAVMIKLYKALPKFRGEAALSTFITRIAVTTSLDALRRRKRSLSRFFSPATNDDRTLEQIPSLKDHTREHEQRQMIGAALMGLPPDFRVVAILRLQQGYSTLEVADMLKISEGTVFSRLSRARKHLKAALEKEMSQ
ncbi:MAG: sigma-70 family RNA polymerase sigma factor [Pseudomonadota bacterium]